MSAFQTLASSSIAFPKICWEPSQLGETTGTFSYLAFRSCLCRLCRLKGCRIMGSDIYSLISASPRSNNFLYLGPLPRRHGPADPWLEGNRNGLQPTSKTMYEKDQDTITTLLRSGRVNLNELLIFHTPELLLNQGEIIDPANVHITDIINAMARSRRSLLLIKLLKKKINLAECDRLSKDLSRWPVQVQQLQGEVSELKGRYVRIPQILVDKIALLS